MNHLRFVFIVLICSLCAPALQAQIALHGKITGSGDSAAVEFVSVYIPEMQRGTVTDTLGAFSFDNLPATTITIQFSRLGFKSAVQTVNPEKTPNLEVRLDPSATEMEEVLVTTSNTKLSDNTPFPVAAVAHDDIRRYASPSLMGNLSYQPGIDRITIGNGIGKPVIRGLSFNRILLYSQGTRIENQQWDDHHDLGLTDRGIEHIEVVRGPAALIYGADALGGALIFVDEKPLPAGISRGDVNFGFDSNTQGLDLDAGVQGTGKDGVFYGVRLGGSSHTSYLQGQDQGDNEGESQDGEFAFNSKYMNSSGNIAFGVSKKWGVSKFSYNYFNQLIGIIEDEAKDTNNVGSGNEEKEQRDREMEAPYQNVTSHVLSSENTLFTGKSKINLNVAYQMNIRKEYEPLEDKRKELAIGLDLNAITYDLKWTSNAEKKWGITLGTQGMFLKNENNGKEALVPNADETDIAGYGLFRYDRGKLNLLGGVRCDMRSIKAESYEKFGFLEEDTLILLPGNDTLPEKETEIEKDYTPVTFSLGAAYHLTPALMAKLNFASGFTAPNYAQLGTFGNHEGAYRFERGNDQLNVEQNNEGDLGLSWEGGSMTLTAAGYINMVKDYIYIANTGSKVVRITPESRDTLPVYDYRQGDATLSGGEFGVDIHPKTVSWLDLKATYAIVEGTLDAGGSLPYIPSNKLVGELQLTKKKLWRMNNAYVSFVASNFAERGEVAEYEIATEGYTLFDMSIGASFRLGKQQASFRIYCTNLADTGYYNQLSLVKEIGVREMGRNIGLQVHIPFGIKTN